MKKRYTVEQTKHKEWFNIIDHKENRSFWMHITDFGIVNNPNTDAPGAAGI